MKSRFNIQTPAYQLYLEGYDKLIKAVGYKQTGRCYQDAVKELLNYLETNQKTVIQEVQTVDMVNYYEYLSTRKNLRTEGVLSTHTINRHMLAIQIFFDYLLEEGIIKRSILLPKISNHGANKRNILPIEEIQSLYNVCENKRDKAILTLAYGCGARRDEIARLQVKDVQLSIGVLIIRKGKNDKRREIPLTNTIINDLKDYLVNERHTYFKNKETKRTENFLVNNKGKRMQGDHINERLKELVEKTNNPEIIGKDITLHCLRHSIATHLLDNGASIEFVRDFMGHSEIDTVHVYARRRKVKQKQLKQLQ